MILDRYEQEKKKYNNLLLHYREVAMELYPPPTTPSVTTRTQGSVGVPFPPLPTDIHSIGGLRFPPQALHPNGAFSTTSAPPLSSQFYLHPMVQSTAPQDTILHHQSHIDYLAHENFALRQQLNVLTNALSFAQGKLQSQAQIEQEDKRRIGNLEQATKGMNKNEIKYRKEIAGLKAEFMRERVGKKTEVDGKEERYKAEIKALKEELRREKGNGDEEEVEEIATLEVEVEGDEEVAEDKSNKASDKIAALGEEAPAVNGDVRNNKVRKRGKKKYATKLRENKAELVEVTNSRDELQQQLETLKREQEVVRSLKVEGSTDRDASCV